MGNCISSPKDIGTKKYVRPVQPINTTAVKSTQRDELVKRQMHEEKKLYEKLTEEERALVRNIKREERERIKQAYNLRRLRETLDNDMESFLLNNILFSVQFFENFDRDRSSFTIQRLREESRMNAPGGLGGGLSSIRHKKRASLPDTMQEIVGRWVRLDPPILNSPAFTARPNEKTVRSRSCISLASSTEKLTTCKELLVPLRIMVVHEDVRIVEKDGEEDLYRAIIPEPIPKMAGYLKLRCIGNWPEEKRNEELYEMNMKDKEAVHEKAISEEAEYAHSSGDNGSQRVREDESEYSYLCKKLYDKTLKDKEYTPVVNSSESSIDSDSDDEKLNTFEQRLSPGEKLLAGIKKRGVVSHISQRPPMKPPHDITVNPLPQESEPEIPYADDLNPPRFALKGRRDSGTVQNPPAWPFKPPSTSRITGNFSKNNEAPQGASTSKDSDNWKLGKSAHFGNIYKRLNNPKMSVSTENSDSDYGYATIPTSHTPQPTAKRHGGIPHKCLTKVRYRHIEGEDDEEFDLEGEELARRIEEQGGDPGELFITKTFLNPSKFLTAFAEEVQWRDYGYSLTNGDSRKGSSAFPTGEQRNPIQRQSRNSKVSVDSGNGAEDDDDSLQACLGIPASVPVTASDASWFSQRDRHGMRFPIEIIPSITIPWPREETVAWLYGRRRKAVVIDERTKEKRPAWPGRLVYEASRTACHVVAPPNFQHKNLELPKTQLKQDENPVPKLGWKICFCESERVLEEGLTHTQTRCLLFAMLLRRCYLQWDKFGLSQNFVRTAFYWQCEEGKLNWPEEEMGYNLKAVLAEMYKGLKRRKLPDYFIKKKNIAVEEVQMALPKAQSVLHSMEEVLSIHVARAISGLQFSDSRVPILDFKRFVHILTDEHAWMTLNPELFAVSMAADVTSEDEEGESSIKVEKNEPSQISQKEMHGISQTKPLSPLKPANLLQPTISSQEVHKETARPTYGDNVVEFLRIGTKYKVNEGIVREKPAKETDVPETHNSSKLKPIKVKVVKGPGTLNAKKQQQRPELSDAFSRLKKTDKDREWNAQYRKHLAEQKKKDSKKEESEDDDMFAKAEMYKPAEVSSNHAKRRLLLSFFANHFEQLGRRCGRNWGAIRVADSYLRHAENLATLLAEHEGVSTDYDDDDEGNMGEAKNILDRVKKEFEHLTNLRSRKTARNSRISDSEQSTGRVNSVHHGNIAKPMPNLHNESTKRQINERLSHGSSRSMHKGEQNTNEELSSEDERL